MTARLLLIEFFPGTLRRNEKSILFPFLAGLARETGRETLWLCFGGALAPAAEGYGGRQLRARLNDEDLAALTRHVAAFRPTHVISSDQLSTAAEEILEAFAPPAARLVMPTISDVVFGTPAMSGLAAALALISGEPGRDDYLARCGWFLSWTGASGAPGASGASGAMAAGRHLVTDVVPDYDAVLANPSARDSRPPVSIVSGGICGSRRRLARNPCFAAVDPHELGDHLGCSFCMSAMMPPYTPDDVDPLPLWERQLRRLQETAGPDGRNRGVYEFFDYRAFRRIDDVARLVVQLRLPPSVLMFNPRVDEVLGARERLERTLPLLAQAGHEVRILSMGVENFAPRENARFNKGISVDQVDELLTLASRLERAHPGVFMPFKGGQQQIELGFILFTPWTTLADLRLNLEQAAARGFSPTGYWLYSTLDIQEMEPMYLLARQAGDVLVERFPDPGQYYGVFLNESEVGHLVPWRFREPLVAEYFAVLVRVCAAEREGAASEFFRHDGEFPAMAAEYLEARRRAALTPLAVGLALLDVIEARPEPPLRRVLLSEALARAAGPPAAPAPRAEPASAAVVGPTRGLARAVARATRDGAGGLVVRDIAAVGEGPERRVRLTVALGGRSVVLDLLDGGAAGPCYLRSRHFRVVYHQATPITSPSHRAALERLLRQIDDAIDAEPA